ncbi:hypothetical protein EDC96DRAFT_577907 [Choanephora cucurbitarum]|nr:hypothetical protein EDC96DRAFT_577907 [Choanephora cucurbitarum]
MRLTNAEKLELGYRYYKAKPNNSQESLCVWAKREFQLDEEPTKSTIPSSISKGAKFPLLESKLADFVKRMQDSSFVINSHSLKAEAERLLS